MNLLSRHIEYLLGAHDCVILPGWGAFLCRYVPARWDEGGSTILPPSREVCFNPSVSHNDGLLVSSVMRREGLSYDAALESVETEVASLRHQLSSDGEVALPGVGLFSLSEGETPIFTPHPVAGFFSALPTLPLRPVLEEARAEEEEANQVEEDKNQKIIRVPLLRRALRVAACIAVLLGLGLVLSTPITTDESSSEIYQASMPSPASIVRDINTVPADGIIAISIPDIATSTAEVDTVARAKYRHRQLMLRQIREYNERRAEARALALEKRQAQKAAPSAAPSSRISPSENYCVVISSQPSKARAERFARSHGGQVLVQDGRYRVYIATSGSEAHARQLASQLRGQYPGAWVCEKK